MKTLINAIMPIIIVLMVFAIVATFPDQILEVYRYTAQTFILNHEIKIEGIKEYIIQIIFALFFSVTLMLCSFLLISEKNSVEEITKYSDTLTITIASIAAFPLVALGIGWDRALIDVGHEGLRDILLKGAELSYSNDIASHDIISKLASFEVDSRLSVKSWLHIGSIVFFVLAVAIFVTVFLNFNKLSLFGNDVQRHIYPILGLAIAAPIILSVAISIFPVDIGRSLTPFGVIFLF